jgi:hypothetical protein
VIQRAARFQNEVTPNSIRISKSYMSNVTNSCEGGLDLLCDRGALEHLDVAVRSECAEGKGLGLVVLALVVARLAERAGEVERRVRRHVVDAERAVSGLQGRCRKQRTTRSATSCRTSSGRSSRACRVGGSPRRARARRRRGGRRR